MQSESKVVQLHISQCNAKILVEGANICKFACGCTNWSEDTWAQVRKILRILRLYDFIYTHTCHLVPMLLVNYSQRRAAGISCLTQKMQLPVLWFLLWFRRCSFVYFWITDWAVNKKGPHRQNLILTPVCRRRMERLCENLSVINILKYTKQ